MPDVGSVSTVLRTVTLNHGPGIDEQDLVEHISLTELIDHHLDFSNLSQVNSTIIRIFEKANSSSYNQISRRTFPDDYEEGTKIVRIILDGAGQDMKITLQSIIDEGGTKEILGTTRDIIRI